MPSTAFFLVLFAAIGHDPPLQYRKNLDTIDAPLNRMRSQAPVWKENDIQDVIAFLSTLVDQDLVGKEGTQP